ECEGCQLVTEQTRLAGALDHVVRRGEQRAATERENHRVGVQGPQTTIAEPRNIEIQLWPDELCGDPNADSHTDDPPDHGHDGKLPHNTVIEDLWLFSERIGSTHELPLIN